MGALSDCDLLIEAVFELMNVKKDIFRRFDAIAKPGAILASNTSYLNVNEMAAVTRRPESVVGMHFFSPANVMKLIEVVRGDQTSHVVLRTVMDLAKRVGKVAVVSGVCHGFIGNRMLARRQEQAAQLVIEGALPWEVDQVLLEFGLPMGPFQMTDLAGLDVGWTRENSTGSTLKEVLCEADRRGQKNGRGFYDYDAMRNRRPSLEVVTMIETFRTRLGVTPRQIDADEIRERLLYPLVNEGALILEEGIAQRASDIDLVWINGYGWPKQTGGPMHWADAIGHETVAVGLGRWRSHFGPDFRVASAFQCALVLV
jgi:3-hydroxyacyl-CoA dehydrogenase